MPNLQFNQLTVISDTKKSGNQFQFHPKNNLITASDNSYGKSTLVKLLYWSLGCDPHFDSYWKNFEVKTLLNFSIGKDSYQVSRYGNNIFIKKEDEEWLAYPKITGDYSKYFMDIVGFKVLLPNKNDPTKLETPPPSFYCLPFYIDQRKGWSYCWEDFLSLAQYARWDKTVIQYHTGYLSAGHFEIEKVIAARSETIKSAQKVITDIDTTIEVIDNHINPLAIDIAITSAELANIEKDININVTKLKSEQETIFNSLYDKRVEREFLSNQLNIALLAIQDIEKDYVFSIENIANDILMCPLCGVEHDNSLINKTSILTDKTKAEHQANNLQQRITRLDRSIEDLQKNLSELSSELDKFNTKYETQFKDVLSEQNTDISIIDILATNKIKKYTNETKINNLSVISDNIKKNQHDKKNQKKLLSKEDKIELNNKFTSILLNYTNDLNATGIDLEPLKSPWDYKKLYGSGGASESNRGILAYRFTILNLINNANNEVFSPIIVDTPKQNEPTDLNYELTIKFITKHTPKETQLFICALDSPEISTYKNKAHTITLNKNKILSKDKYDELKSLFDFHSNI